MLQIRQSSGDARNRVDAPAPETAHSRDDGCRVEAFAPKANLRVGYATNGNPLQMNDKDRSAPPNAFASLLETPGVQFFDLSEQADRERGFTDMQDTAQLVQQLDLVITVDTSIGHLAGVLGVPCWLLAQTAPEWRCGMPNEWSMHPWYKGTTKLYRRTSVHAWPEMMERVKSDLLKLVEK